MPLRGRTILLIFAVLTAAPLWAQNPKPHEVPACGSAKVHLTSPVYLRAAEAIVVVQLPPGWLLDKSHRGPFFFVRKGENYNTASTLMYINVQSLPYSLSRAVQEDTQSAEKSCDKLRVRNLAPADLLEEGCDRVTQEFSCQRKTGSYVDLVTKIGIRGLLLNVVLSADSALEISKYKDDYKYLLSHLTLVE
jgi:hypothetical protein